MLVKILMTLSIAIGAFLSFMGVWAVIKKVKVKDFLEAVQAALADGRVTPDEALNMVSKFWAIFQKDPVVPA